MKCTLSLMLLSLMVLSCSKETKVDTTSTTSDTVITDTMPADTAAVTSPSPMPSDTVNRTDTASVKRMDTVRTRKK
ncbi:MAG: hypothetical protein LBE92_07045 [Chryseobacterium sp.]|uniref:hypothetical protein n=1 Tax=Chryseobacterium sp. TaxID=1871047 RepID=UPI002818C90F|nr:hypothetical protein [Chryseobacterium sp.]MDR2235863.1 hypothetical protein [Chryseobacterium sp.]